MPDGEPLRDVLRLLTLDLPAVAPSVPAARTRVMHAVEDLAADAPAIALAVSEAVANAVVHAYRFEDSPGRVRVTVDGACEAIEVCVADDGVGLSPRADSPGAGLGIPLMRSLSEELALDGADGTLIAMRFPAARVAALAA